MIIFGATTPKLMARIIAIAAVMALELDRFDDGAGLSR
jgi:hypothetical protein